MIRLYHLFLGTIGFAAIILYGSLVPFQFESRPFVELFDQFISICQQPIQLRSRSDFLANILLFVPLSFLLLGTLQQAYPTYRHLFYLPVILICITFGTSIEFLQLVFPPRSTSLNDILAQAIGSIAGVVLWSLAGQQAISFYNTHTARLQDSNRVVPLLFLYLLMVVILNAVPFDFTISPVEVVHKYREGRIEWMPFRSLQYADLNLLHKWLWHAVVFLPIGILLGMGKSKSALSITGIGLLFASCIELMQVFVLSRNVDTSDILTGAFAVLAGWGIMRWHHRHQRHIVLFASLSLWIITAVVINWSPFHFTLENVASQWSNMTFIPMSDYQSKNYLSAFDDIAHKRIFFVLLGVLISAFSNSTIRSSMAFIISGLASTIIEAGQLLVPGRTPSVSDILLGAGAGAAGCWIASNTSKQETLQ